MEPKQTRTTAARVQGIRYLRRLAFVASCLWPYPLWWRPPKAPATQPSRMRNGWNTVRKCGLLSTACCPAVRLTVLRSVWCSVVPYQAKKKKKKKKANANGCSPQACTGFLLLSAGARELCLNVGLGQATGSLPSL